MEREYPGLAAAIKALGKTRRERAAKLQTTPKTVDRLLYRLPESIKPLCAQPHLLRILADEIERRLAETEYPNLP